MECYYCKETKSLKEFCDSPENNGHFACLSCDENMRNCDGCEDCPDTFYKDLYHIDGEYFCKECYKEKEEKDAPICSICQEEYTGFGNNAQPVNDGQCCDSCNSRTVLPARMMAKPKRVFKSRTKP